MNAKSAEIDKLASKFKVHFDEVEPRIEKLLDENKELQNSLYDFMIDMLKNMIKIGINRTKCYCMGSGGNYNFLMQINEKYGFLTKLYH